MHYKPFSKTSLLWVLICGIFIISTGYVYQRAKVIQININELLNTRPVTTLTKGVLVSWRNGVDRQDGYLTASAAELNGDDDKHALPDDPLTPGNSHHPAILLHYNNKDGLKNQARYITDTNSFVIKIPESKYSDMYLSLTSAYGKTNLQVELQYKDGNELKVFIIPDWANDIPDSDPDFSYVVHNMAKWGASNNLVEKDHHNIDALNIHPDAKRTLMAVRIKKISATYLVFWGATGVKQ
jgi:hypothetical protein